MSSVKSFLKYLLNPRAQYESVSGPAVIGDASAAMPAYSLTPRARFNRLAGNIPLVVGLLVLLGLIFVVLFGPLWASFDPNLTAQSVLPHYEPAQGGPGSVGGMVAPPFPPSADHALGTDQWGNDMVSLLIYGARVTLVIALYITALRLLIGTILGGLAGWYADRWIDRFIMGLIAVFTAIPLLLSSLILILALDINKGMIVFIVALSVLGWTEIAQRVRAQLMQIRKMLFIEAAESVGLSELQIVVRHALPHLLPQLLVIGALEMGAALLIMAELAFLGIFVGGGSRFSLDPVFGGVPVHLIEVPEWGGLIGQGVRYVRTFPHLVIAPALAFFVAIFGMNALGEGLRRLIEDTGVSTGFLLQKRTWAILAVLVAISYVVIERTGPSRSYRLMAEQFSGQTALSHAEQLAAASGQFDEDGIPLAATYIAGKFNEYGLQRGWRVTFASEYLYDGTQKPTVLGFLPGYDYDLSPELLLLVASYDSEVQSGQEANNAGVAVLLELARLIQDKHFDPRRSIVFVAWGGDPEDPAQLASFLTDPENFIRLPVPSRGENVPVAAIFLDQVGRGGDRLWLDPGADSVLLDLFKSSAASFDIRTTDAGTAGPPIPLSTQPDLPSIQLHWAEDNQAQGGATTLKLEKVGQLMTFALGQLARQTTY